MHSFDHITQNVAHFARWVLPMCLFFRVFPRVLIFRLGKLKREREDEEEERNTQASVGNRDTHRLEWQSVRWACEPVYMSDRHPSTRYTTRLFCEQARCFIFPAIDKISSFFLLPNLGVCLATLSLLYWDWSVVCPSFPRCFRWYVLWYVVRW